MLNILGRLGERVRVEPGQSPIWENSGRDRRKNGFLRDLARYGRNNFLGDRPINMSYQEQEEMQADIRESIEKVILIKFKETTIFTEAEKKGMQMTMKAQAKGHSKVIFEEACHRVERNHNLAREAEHMTEQQIADLYYEEVKREAEKMADGFEFTRNINIQGIIKRETRVKEQLQKGEITPKQAEEILKEALVVQREGEEQSPDQAYEETYEQLRQEEREEKLRRRGQRPRNNGSNNRRRQPKAKGGKRAQNFRNTQRRPDVTQQESPVTPTVQQKNNIHREDNGLER